MTSRSLVSILVTVSPITQSDSSGPSTVPQSPTLQAGPAPAPPAAGRVAMARHNFQLTTFFKLSPSPHSNWEATRVLQFRQQCTLIFTILKEGAMHAGII